MLNRYIERFKMMPRIVNELTLEEALVAIENYKKIPDREKTDGDWYRLGELLFLVGKQYEIKKRLGYYLTAIAAMKNIKGELSEVQQFTLARISYCAAARSPKGKNKQNLNLYKNVIHSLRLLSESVYTNEHWQMLAESTYWIAYYAVDNKSAIYLQSIAYWEKIPFINYDKNDWNFYCYAKIYAAKHSNDKKRQYELNCEALVAWENCDYDIVDNGFNVIAGVHHNIGDFLKEKHNWLNAQNHFYLALKYYLKMRSPSTDFTKVYSSLKQMSESNSLEHRIYEYGFYLLGNYQPSNLLTLVQLYRDVINLSNSPHFLIQRLYELMQFIDKLKNHPENKNSSIKNWLNSVEGNELFTMMLKKIQVILQPSSLFEKLSCNGSIQAELAYRVVGLQSHVKSQDEKIAKLETQLARFGVFANPVTSIDAEVNVRAHILP